MTTTPNIQSTLDALSEDVRRRILSAFVLAHPEPLTPTFLSASLDLPMTTINHHVQVLCRTGLVIGIKSGRNTLYGVDASPIRELISFLTTSFFPKGFPDASTLQHSNPPTEGSVVRETGHG